MSSNHSNSKPYNTDRSSTIRCSAARLRQFQASKETCLGKRDKSSAGRIDVRAVEICSVLNDRNEYYTLSSCSGRCFLYRGLGAKAGSSGFGGGSSGSNNGFVRYRVNHDLISDPQRYFDLSTLLVELSHPDYDPTGGGDSIPTVGQYDYKQTKNQFEESSGQPVKEDDFTQQISFESTKIQERTTEMPPAETTNQEQSSVVWLRFEPFILHVACRSMRAVSELMAAARPAFKNVGLTSFSETPQSAKYVVAIWGDEGLEMPLTKSASESRGTTNFDNDSDDSAAATKLLFCPSWLGEQINERHERNWAKIQRFVDRVRRMPVETVNEIEWLATLNGLEDEEMMQNHPTIVPKRFDVIGDVAILNTMPEGQDLAQVGDAILKKNKAIKICAARTGSLKGKERCAGASLQIIAGPNRSPLVTTHREYGISCVVDLEQTFFSPRMGPERLRICQQVARGEHVLVLFCGVGLDAMQIAGRTEATSVTAVEWNTHAVECARRGHRMLKRNKAVKCPGAADRLVIFEGDALEVMKTLEKGKFHRVVAPRPKEGALDGDLGVDGGADFLKALVPLLKEKGGECHWYDFAADHELPTCQRTRGTIERVCAELGCRVEIFNVANAGSVAKRQFRVCVDFRITGKVRACNES